MNRTWITVLILVSLGVQTLPVRVCAVEAIVAGSNCHQPEFPTSSHSQLGDPATATFGGHAAGSSDQHDPACKCDAPKAELERCVLLTRGHDLAPVALSSLYIPLLAANHLTPPAVAAVSDVATIAICLPLLN